MPPKRKAEDSENGPAKKKAATGPKLKKSKAPKWDSVPYFSFEKPTGEWAMKCIERWCLLPPYDTSITEKQWEDYFNERSALDKINSSGAVESKPIVSQELEQDTWKILRKTAGDLAAIVLGSKLDEDRKQQIARTLMGALYFTELWGNDEGDGSPRQVQVKTRLYSPFGIGTSIDLFYWYHFRIRSFGAGEKFAFLHAKSRLPIEIDPKNPTRCSAIALDSDGVCKAGPDAITVFERKGKKSKGTTAANIKSFEEALFHTEGWISPLKLVEILYASATVMRYGESDKTTPKSVLEKFNYFDGENNGGSLLARELESLGALEAKEPVGEAEVCVPRRLLLLARHGGTSGQAGPSGQAGGA